jgi:hypothetical protein
MPQDISAECPSVLGLFSFIVILVEFIFFCCHPSAKREDLRFTAHPILGNWHPAKQIPASRKDDNLWLRNTLRSEAPKALPERAAPLTPLIQLTQRQRQKPGSMPGFCL